MLCRVAVSSFEETLIGIRRRVWVIEVASPQKVGNVELVCIEPCRTELTIEICISAVAMTGTFTALEEERLAELHTRSSAKVRSTAVA